VLTKALEPGETLTLEYWTVLRYEPQAALDNEYRRVAVRPVQNVDIRIEFHPDALPAHVWWATWDTMQGQVIEQHEATLDSQHAVQRFLGLAEKAVIGFHWDWLKIVCRGPLRLVGSRPCDSRSGTRSGARQTHAGTGVPGADARRRAQPARPRRRPGL